MRFSLWWCVAAFVVLTMTGRVFAQCENCTSMPILYDPTCSQFKRERCVGTMGTPTFVAGEPGDPVVLATCICTACDSDQAGSVDCSYSETSGHQFCITITGGVEWGVPLGPTWSVDVETSYCCSTSITTTTSFEVACDPGTKRRGTMTAIETPVTVSIEVEYERHRIYVPRRGCTRGGFVDDQPCDTQTYTSTSSVNTYEATFEDLPCPPAPPGTGGGGGEGDEDELGEGDGECCDLDED